ncbi:ATP-binding cassette domain-containing protein [Bifidobacterium longum subsp. infantis]
MSTLIRLEHLSAEVRLPDGERLTTVDDVSASFERGTSTAIIGKSGSGKTSLASIVGLLNNDYDGTLSYDGRDCAAWNDADRARFRCRHVGFVFQNYSLIPHLSAWENVALPLQYRGGIPLRVIRRRASRMLHTRGRGGPPGGQVAPSTAAGCHRPDGQGRHGDVGRDGIHHGSEADDDDRHQPYPGPAVRPLVTHAHVLRLSFGPRRDWRGSVARRMPGGRFSSLLQDVHRRRQSYRLRWKRRRRRC